METTISPLKSRLIVYYLPQYYPIPENDENWGKGFTEWTNVSSAKPLYRGHYQPNLPTDLGYYDLRIPEVREQQADLAREYGIEGFCYWHYWFGNRVRALDKIFNEVLRTGKPNFPFCLCWANHSWKKHWEGAKAKLIFEQKYPGTDDYVDHFYELLPAFKDTRYIKIDGKLLFSIFKPLDFPDCKLFIATWRQLANKENLSGFYFIGLGLSERQRVDLGFDGISELAPHPQLYRFPITFLDKISLKFFKKKYIDFKSDWLKIPKLYDYRMYVNVIKKHKYGVNEFPVALPNWDHTPRSAKKAIILHGSTPELFSEILSHCVEAVSTRSYDKRIIFIKAWNEWAEGNFLEPEKKFGAGYLKVIKRINKV